MGDNNNGFISCVGLIEEQGINGLGVCMVEVARGLIG
jgi:hypothetical protein